MSKTTLINAINALTPEIDGQATWADKTLLKADQAKLLVDATAIPDTDPNAVVTPPVVGTDLAKGRPTTSSSVYSSAYLASFATDGNSTTRWSSACSDNQWLCVDLGAVFNISRVKMVFDPAYAKSYKLQVSNDNINWTDIYSTTAGTILEDKTGLSGSGRYIRFFGITRITSWGFSLWSFEVYGVLSGGPTTDLPPVLEITSPVVGLTYKAGDLLHVAWTASDPENKPLTITITAGNFAPVIRSAASGATDFVLTNQIIGSFNIAVSVSDGPNIVAKSIQINVQDVIVPITSTTPNGSIPWNYNHCTDIMDAKTYVNVVLMESNSPAATDTSGTPWEDWTLDEMNLCNFQIRKGLDFWEALFAKTFPTSKYPLKFTMGTTNIFNPVMTSYEPITLNFMDSYSTWVKDYVKSKGFPGLDVITELKQINHSFRIANGCNWSVTVFVVDSSLDVDGKFKDGYFAWSMYNGPASFLTYKNGGWNPENMYLVAAHELGHGLGGMLDEYPGGSSYTAKSPVWQIQNLNAYDGSPDLSKRVPSIMAEANYQYQAYNELLASPSSLQMAGWDRILSIRGG